MCPWSPAPSRWAGQRLPPKAAAVGTTCGEQHSESEGHVLDLSSRPRPRVGRVNRAVCLFSLLPQDFFQRNVLNANDPDCRTICGLCGGKKKKNVL